MPVIAAFYGITIRMRDSCAHDDPPLFQAGYQEHTAVFDADGNLKEGDMPKRQKTLIVAWAEIHRDALRANRDRAAIGQPLLQIAPLV